MSGMYWDARSPEVETMRTRLFSGAVCATWVARLEEVPGLVLELPLSNGIRFEVAECVPGAFVEDGVRDRVSLLM